MLCLENPRDMCHMKMLVALMQYVVSCWFSCLCYFLAVTVL